MEIEKAVRQAIPSLIGIAGQSGSGKTYSALLLAAGMMKPDEKVGLIDTEFGRGRMYADDPLIKEVLPQGYDVMDFKEPFSPERYREAVEKFINAGYKILIIDSMSHEYEGIGGLEEIAQSNKAGWLPAKLRHRKLMNRLLQCGIHIIFCLRAREKVKIIEDGGKQKYVPLGVQPICEKNFIFEQLLMMTLDEQTKVPYFNKCPNALRHIFAGMTMLTPHHGEQIRAWCDGGIPIDHELESLKQECRDAAMQGMDNLLKFWNALTPKQKTKVDGYKNECKKIAQSMESADEEPQEPTIGDDNYVNIL